MILAVPGNAETVPKSITVGLIPGGKPEAIKSESKIIAEQLQKKFSIPVNIYISKDYAGLTTALKSKKVDYAFLSALSLVEAEKEVPLKVLLKKTYNGPYYFSGLVVRADSKIKSVKDLKGRAIAFVDRQSTSGYLYPQVYLRKNNFTDESFKSISFSGSHAASVEKLENREVDVAAVFVDDEKTNDGAWERFKKNPKSKFRLLWVSEPIPNDPIVVRTEFYNQYPKLTHELMYELIEMQNDPTSKKLISEVMGKGDLMPATSKQYDPVREVNKVFNK
jgi:phosphonate transport system substrate-binding protein